MLTKKTNGFAGETVGSVFPPVRRKWAGLGKALSRCVGGEFVVRQVGEEVFNSLQISTEARATLATVRAFQHHSNWTATA